MQLVLRVRVRVRVRVSRRTVYLVTGSACDEIWARYGGSKWFLSKTLVHFLPHSGLHQPTLVC